MGLYRCFKGRYSIDSSMVMQISRFNVFLTQKTDQPNDATVFIPTSPASTTNLCRSSKHRCDSSRRGKADGTFSRIFLQRSLHGLQKYITDLLDNSVGQKYCSQPEIKFPV
jgi:hypothetical protein